MNRYWRRLRVVLAGLLAPGLVLGPLLGTAQAAQGTALPFKVQARAAVLMDVQTGRVLYSYHAQKQLSPASLTKLLTAELVEEALGQGRIKPTTKVTIDKRAASIGGSTDGLQVGQQVSIKDLLKLALVGPGNDAAAALATYLGGNRHGFAAVMNQRAKQLGLQHSHFSGGVGLPGPSQHSTAGDLARLARHLVNTYPALVDITSQRSVMVPGSRRVVYNHNGLLWQDSRVKGLKSGWTSTGGDLAVYARQGSQQLVAVILGVQAGSQEQVRRKRRQVAERLLNYGFNNFSTIRLDFSRVLPHGEPVTGGRLLHLDVRPQEPLVVTVRKRWLRDLQVHVQYPQPALRAPVREGQDVGTVTVLDHGQTLASSKLIALQAVKASSWWLRSWRRLAAWLRHLVSRILAPTAGSHP